MSYTSWRVITIYIHQSKSGNPVGRISHVVLADETQLRDSSGTSGVDGGGGRGGRSRFTELNSAENNWITNSEDELTAEGNLSDPFKGRHPHAGNALIVL